MTLIACRYCGCTEDSACLIATPSTDAGAAAPLLVGRRACGWATYHEDGRTPVPVCDSPNCLARLDYAARTEAVAARFWGMIRRDNPAALVAAGLLDPGAASLDEPNPDHVAPDGSSS